MREMENRHERVELARWIADYILSLSDKDPWIEGHSVIKKTSLMFAAEF